MNETAVKSMEESRYQEAERGFRVYQTAYPDAMEAYWNLAVTYERSGNVEGAKNELKAFLVREPGAEEVQEYLDQLESAGQ